MSPFAAPTPAPSYACTEPSGAFCKALFDQDAVGIAEVDLAGRVRRANGRFRVFARLDEDELSARRLQDLTIEPVNLSRVVEAGPLTVEVRFRADEGRWLEFHVSRIEAVGEPTFLVLAQDVTGRQRAEAAHRADNVYYRTLFDSLDTGFCVINVLFDAQGRGVDYRFLETNAAFEKNTGLTQAVGRTIGELATGVEQCWFDTYADVALTGRPVRVERESRALGRWFSLYAFRIGPPEEHKVAVLFEDVTARKKADQRRSILAGLAETVADLRAESDIVRHAVNGLGNFLKAHRCFLAEPSESGEHIAVSENHTRAGAPGIAGPLDLAMFGGSDLWRAIVRKGAVIGDVISHPLTRNHASAYVRLGIRSLLAQPFKEGARVATVLVVADDAPRVWSPDEIKLADDVISRVWPVVQRARSERALLAAHDELEQRVAERTANLHSAVAELEAYSYSISHDLRAPLRAMQTYAGILVEDCADRMGSDGREYLQRIMAASERMDRLIRDVLLFSRTARADTTLEPVPLAPLLASVVESYPALNASGGQIEVVEPLATVEANPAALTQCVANLLGNAIKFVAPGVRPRIRVWSVVEGDRVRIHVRDNGIGVPAQHREKIFGVFYRGEHANNDNGTGIGLAIVRKAVDRMGGRVGVDSVVGQGSTFWIELTHAPDA